ncbi:MAG: UDP-3-O-acyl-N-acetylglucosamine deacetylase, partial [Bacteroidales bacterium]
MDKKQTSIKKPVTLRGIGLHTGSEVELTIKPAPVDHWYKFKRTDLKDEPVIDAIADNIVDTSRGTSIANQDVRVSTVEHLLAAAYGLEIDNLLFEINGPEVPILDGSSRYWVEA